MPPSTRRQQFQDIRRWESSPNVNVASKQLPRDSSSVGNIGGRPLDDRKFRARLAVEKKRDPNDSSVIGPGGTLDEVNDYDEGLSSDDDEDSVVSDDEDSPTPPAFPNVAAAPQATNSVNGPTLTAVPPSRVTALLEKASEAASQPTTTSGPGTIPIMLSSSPPETSKVVVTSTVPTVIDATSTPTIATPFWPIQNEQPSPLPSGLTTPYPTPEAVEDLDSGPRKEDDDDDHWWKDSKSKGSSKGLDETAEHLLIAAGAIGAFILFCFVSWVVYRALKKPKPKSQGGGSGGFIDKFTWRRKEPMEGTWDGRTLYMSNEPPPYYGKGDMGASYYGPGKVYSPGPGSVARSVGAGFEGGTLRPSPNNEAPLASIIDQYPPSNDGGAGDGDVNTTMRSRMPDPYYNQSELARQPSDAYDPAQRKAYRASELSSISSGFGDGDMIVPQDLAVNKPPPAPTTNNSAARFSWMSRGNDRRETMYTATSEDRPARFRTVGSWVNQQAGRVKRAGSRARERGEVPVMPAIPGELNVTQQTTYR